MFKLPLCKFSGSPFKFHVDSISSGYVTAYGSGLTHGVSGEPANFTISTKGAGAGNIRQPTLHIRDYIKISLVTDEVTRVL